jgi:hypothetical protein
VADFTYISLGAGVQSSALLIMSAKGMYGCPKADIAVFADTGDEPQWVYDYLELLIPWGAEHGIPVHTTSKGKLSEWVITRQKEGKRFVSVPLFTEDEFAQMGILRRQCTREFKIHPIEQYIRRYLGYKPRQHCKHQVDSLHGISIDEATRMKPSQLKWMHNKFPLVEANLSREDCLAIIAGEGLPEPKKSSCVYCPYHSDHFWYYLKNDYPEEFAKAVEFDHAIRDMTMRGMESLAYIHRSCMPLEEVIFDCLDEEIDYFENECEGMCGL